MNLSGFSQTLHNMSKDNGSSSENTRPYQRYLISLNRKTSRTEHQKSKVAFFITSYETNNKCYVMFRNSDSLLPTQSKATDDRLNFSCCLTHTHITVCLVSPASLGVLVGQSIPHWTPLGCF